MLTMSRLVRLARAGPSVASCRRPRSSAIEIPADDVTLLDPSEEERLEREKAIELSRNKSRLQPQHYAALHGAPPHEEPVFWTHQTVKYRRRRFARHGRLSGVEPALCFMTAAELEERVEWERVAHPFTVARMIEMAEEKRAAERSAVERRERELDERLSKLRRWIDDLEKRQAAKEALARAAKDKKNRLVEEVRRHFGFTVSPKDERFKALLEEKEKEQKKQEKAAKKAAKEAQLLLKIQQKTV